MTRYRMAPCISAKKLPSHHYWPLETPAAPGLIVCAFTRLNMRSRAALIATPSFPPLYQRIVKPFDCQEAGQLLDPLNPRLHVGVRIERNVTHWRQGNIRKDTDICDGRASQHKPITHAQLLI